MNRHNELEKDTRSIVMRYFDYAQRIGVEKAVRRARDSGMISDRCDLVRVSTMAGDRASCIEGLQDRFMKVPSSWVTWMEKASEDFHLDRNELIRLRGGIPVASFLYARLCICRFERPMLEELNRFMKVAVSHSSRCSDSEIFRHAFDQENNPLLPLLPDFLSMSTEGVEKAVHRSAAELTTIGISLYTEFLKMVYRISNYCRHDLEVPDDLGELMKLVSSLWAEDDIWSRMILYDDLRVIVDSELHRRTGFSPSKLEVTFFDGEGGCIGPLSLVEYTDLYDDYRNNLSRIALIPSIVLRSHLMDLTTGLF